MVTIPEDAAAAYDQQNQILDQNLSTARADAASAQIAAARISAYRLMAPHLPTGAYASLAQAGVDPYSGEFQQIASQYVPQPAANTIQYNSQGIPTLLKRIGTNTDGKIRVGPLQRMLAQAWQSGDKQGQAYYKEALRQARATNGVGNKGVIDYHASDWIYQLEHHGDVGGAISGTAKMVAQPITAALSAPMEIGENLLFESGALTGGYHSGDLPKETLTSWSGWGDALWHGTTLAHVFDSRNTSAGYLPTKASELASGAQQAVRGTNAAGGTNTIGTAAVDAINRTYDFGATGVNALAGVNDSPDTLASHKVFRHELIEPGSGAYNVASGAIEFVAAVEADPANLAFAKWHDLTTAAKTFDVVKEAREAGLVNGFRNMVTPQRFDDWMASGYGAHVASAVADVTSPSKILDYMPSLKGTPGGLGLAQMLAKATDPNEVAAIMREAAGTDLVNIPQYSALTGLGGSGYKIRQLVGNVRAFNMVPGNVLPVNDLDGGYTTFERTLVNNKFPQAVREDFLNRYIDAAQDPNPIARGERLYKIVADTYDTTQRKIAGRGYWTGTQAKSFARGLFDNVMASEGTQAMADQHVADALEHHFSELDQATRDALTPKIADLILNSSEGEKGATQQKILDLIGKETPFKRAHLPNSAATKITRFAGSAYQEAKQRVVDAEQIGGIAQFPVSGEFDYADEMAAATGIHPEVASRLIPIDSVFSVNDMLRNDIRLPDYHAIRRATSMFTRVLGDLEIPPAKFGILDRLTGDSKAIISPYFRAGMSADSDAQIRFYLRAGEFLNHMWKQGNIAFNPRLAARIIANAATASAIDGHETAFSHPIQTIQRLIADSRFGSAEAADSFSGLFADAHARQAYGIAAAGRNFGDIWADSGPKAMLRDFKTFARNSEDFGEITDYRNAWKAYLSGQSLDPISKRIAAALISDNPEQGLANLKDSFWNGPMSQYRKILATSPAAVTEDWMRHLNYQQGAHTYIDVATDLLKKNTAEQGDLLNAIATGMHGDDPIVETLANGRKRFSASLNDRIAELHDQQVGPATVRGRANVTLQGGPRLTDLYDRAAHWFINKVAMRPLDELVNKPVLHDAYVERLTQLLGHEPSDTEIRSIANLSLDFPTAASDGELDAIAARASAEHTIASGETMTAAELDALARAHASTTLERLVYHYQNRSQFTDMLGLLSPFAEVFRQEAVRYARLGFENAPKIAARANQLDQAVASTHVFTKDANGNEVMHIPVPAFVQQVLGAITGALVDDGLYMNMPVKNLSLATSGVPGIGAVASIPASMVMQKITDWGGPDLQKTLLPYGAFDLHSGISGFLQQFSPSWARALAAAAQGPNAKTNAANMAAAMAYLAASHPNDYPRTDAGHAKLLDDASALARQMWILTAIGRATMPTSPKIDQEISQGDIATSRAALDKIPAIPKQDIASGDHGVELFAISQDWRTILTNTLNNGGSTADAVRDFVGKYGTNLASVMVPQTQPKIYGLAATPEIAKFRADNPDIVKAYPDIWPLLAPTPTAGKFDYGEYQLQLDHDQRTLLKPADRQMLMEYRLGSAIYDRYRNMVGLNPNKAQSQWLAGIRQTLYSQYPGFARNDGQFPALTAGKASNDYAIQQVAAAAQDARLAGTPGLDGVAKYMEYRASALASLGATSSASFQSERAAPIRQWLSQIAGIVAQHYPEFANIYDKLFASEIAEPQGAN